MKKNNNINIVLAAQQYQAGISDGMTSINGSKIVMATKQ